MKTRKRIGIMLMKAKRNRSLVDSRLKKQQQEILEAASGSPERLMGMLPTLLLDFQDSMTYKEVLDREIRILELLKKAAK